MPPKKRARVSQAASPAATDQQHKTPTPAAQSPSKADEDVLNDPWTDEEAIGLFKAVIKWKPTGLHKHFRMLQIRQYLLENRYIHPKAAHTSIPGLWRKLNTLYDLEALDEREDARQLSDASESASNSASDSDAGEDDVYSLADNKIHKAPFALPSDDEMIEDLAWKRRFPSEKERRDGSESPAVLPEVNMDREAPVGFLRRLRDDVPGEEPSGPEPEEEEKEKRPRGRPKGSTKAGKQATTAAGERRRSTRQAVEAEDDEDDDDEEEDESDEVDEDEEDEEESSEEEEDGSEETTPAPRSSTRGRGRGRGGGTGTGTGRAKSKKK